MGVYGLPHDRMDAVPLADILPPQKPKSPDIVVIQDGPSAPAIAVLVAVAILFVLLMLK